MQHGNKPSSRPPAAPWLRRFKECNFEVNAAFAADFPRQFDVPDISDLLDAGLKVGAQAAAALPRSCCCR